VFVVLDVLHVEDLTVRDDLPDVDVAYDQPVLDRSGHEPHLHNRFAKAVADCVGAKVLSGPQPD
jgi:hypothetical protein